MKDAPGFFASALTVVVPTYNHAHYLPTALRAILAQTRQADEFILIDDASTDNSVSIVEPLLAAHPEIRFVRNEANLGVVRSMNRGLNISRGTAVAFLAADDVIYPRFFERAMDLLQIYPGAAFASGRTEIIDAAGNCMGPLGGPTPLQHPGFIDARTAGKLLMCKDSWFTGNVTIFRREPLVAIGGFPEDLDSMTDGYVSRRLAVCYGCAFTPEVLGAWRRMESGLAWSQTVDFHYATRIAERVERRMREETEKFPAGYPERWKRRYLFGARRFALATSRRKARSKGIGHYLPALVREIFGTLWLFAIMRPFDIFAMMCRYLRFARVPVNKD